MPRPTRRTALACAAATAAAIATVGARPRAQTAAGSATARLANLRRYLHYDVFTTTPHAGNQLAVFMEPQGLAPEAMAAMTREMNYSECTFVFPAETAGTDVRLRIFGRSGEMPFAGHPVIGSAFALADDGVIAAGRDQFVFGLGIGPTPVALEWADGRLRFAWMTQQLPAFGPSLPAGAALAAAMGIAAADLVPQLPVQEVSCGSAFFYAPLTTRAAVDRVQMNGRELDALFTAAERATPRDLRVHHRGRARRRHRLQPHGRRDRGGRSRHGLGQRAARLLPGQARPGAGLVGRRDRERAGREDGAAEPHPHPAGRERQ